MHGANHPNIKLCWDEIEDPNMKYSLNPEGIERVSFKWVKKQTRAKARALKRTILDYNTP